MKYGGKSQTLALALSLCGASSLRAGYGTNLYPVAEHWRFLNASNRIVVTGLVVHTIEEAWSQSCPTNIPVMPRVQFFNTTNVSDYYYRGALAGTSALARAWTQSWYEVIQVDTSTNGQHAWCYTNLYTNAHEFAHWVGTNLSTSILNSAYELRSGAGTADVPLDKVDMWALHGYWALAERWAVLSTGNVDRTNQVSDAYKPTFPASARANLVRLKAWAKELYPEFCDRAKADTNGYYDVYFAATNPSSTNVVGAYPLAPPTWTNAGEMCAWAGLPSNYLDHTPYRDFNGVPAGAGNVVTSWWVFWSTGAYDVADYTGGLHTFFVTSTNLPETNSVLVTNAVVLPGWNEGDYTYKGWTNVPRAMAWTWNRQGWEVIEHEGRLEIAGIGVTSAPTYVEAHCVTGFAYWQTAPDDPYAVQVLAPEYDLDLEVDPGETMAWALTGTTRTTNTAPRLVVAARRLWAEGSVLANIVISGTTNSEMDGDFEWADRIAGAWSISTLTSNWLGSYWVEWNDDYDAPGYEWTLDYRAPDVGIVLTNPSIYAVQADAYFVYGGADAYSGTVSHLELTAADWQWACFDMGCFGGVLSNTWTAADFAVTNSRDALVTNWLVRVGTALAITNSGGWTVSNIQPTTAAYSDTELQTLYDVTRQSATPRVMTVDPFPYPALPESNWVGHGEATLDAAQWQARFDEQKRLDRTGTNVVVWKWNVPGGFEY